MTSAEARANYDAVVDVTGQAAFNRRDRSLVGVDKAVLRMPAPRYEIGQHEFDPGVDLFCGHAGRQRWIRKVHCRRIKTDQHYAFHRPSSEPPNSVGARLATLYTMRDILERFTVRQKDPSGAILPIDGYAAGS